MGPDRSAGREPTFGELLRACRIAAGLSQEALGARAGVSTEAIGALERGSRRAPYRATLSLLAAALELSEDAFAAFESAALHGRARFRSRAPAPPDQAHNLPPPLTSFIGREAELAALTAAVQSHRLVTIVGFGGVGKTRLALEVARRMLHGHYEDVRFVDLSVLSDGRGVCNEVATTVRPPLGDYGDTPQGLASRLARRKMLLIFDNCEHVVTHVASAAGALLAACPAVAIIATSRERLGIAEEQTFRLSPLRLASPESSAHTLRTSAAVALFCERANALSAPFVATAERLSSITDICRTVDGLPLAIELAASHLPTLGLETLRTRLRDHVVLGSVARDTAPRQRTMRATIAWSYDLLDDLERILFRRLSVFNGGGTLEAAEAVCADDVLERDAVADVLSSLVEKSLVTVLQHDDRARYAMLDLVRTYALGLLNDFEELEEMSRRHAAWLASVADDAGARTFRMPNYLTVSTLAREFANVLSALDWAFAGPVPRAPLLGARIVGGLRSLWIASGQYLDLWRRVEAALAVVDEDDAPLIVSRLLWAYFWSLSGEPRIRAGQRLIALLERLEDRENIAIARMHCAYALFRAGRVAEAQACAQEGLRIIERSGWYQSSAYIFFLTIRALFASNDGCFDRARADLNEADRLARSHGEDYILLMWSPPLRVEVEFLADNLGGAAALAEDALARAPETSADRLVFEALSALAALHVLAGETDDAVSAADELIRRAEGRDQEKVLCAITYLAAVSAARGDARTAALLLGFVDGCCDAHGFGRNAFERQVHTLLSDAVRAALAEDVLQQLRREGAALGTSIAIAEARAAAAVALGSQVVPLAGL